MTEIIVGILTSIEAKKSAKGIPAALVKVTDKKGNVIPVWYYDSAVAENAQYVLQKEQWVGKLVILSGRASKNGSYLGNQTPKLYGLVKKPAEMNNVTAEMKAAYEKALGDYNRGHAAIKLPLDPLEATVVQLREAYKTVKEDPWDDREATALRKAIFPLYSEEKWAYLGYAIKNEAHNGSQARRLEVCIGQNTYASVLFWDENTAKVIAGSVNNGDVVYIPAMEERAPYNMKRVFAATKCSVLQKSDRT